MGGGKLGPTQIVEIQGNILVWTTNFKPGSDRTWPTLPGRRTGWIPLAAEQIDVLLRVVRHAVPRVDRLLDLGCGDGILGRAVLAEYPQANGVFLDFSEHMIEAAKQKADNRRATFVVQDLASKTWTQSVSEPPFDLVLSGLAIHHLPDDRKRELYHEIFDLLKPGGLFLNLEHVAPRRNGPSRRLTTCL